jgi:plastocyanin
MVQQLINVGTVADDGTGDKIRDAFIKANANFTELYANTGGGIALDDFSVTTAAASGSGSLAYDGSGVFTFAPVVLSSVSSAVTFTVVNNGASAYTFSGGGTSNDDNPTLYLQKGNTYEFAVNASGHPFEIRSSNGGSAYNDGVTNNGTASGTVTFTVPMDAPDELFYQCTVHSNMVGTINTGGGSGLQSRTTKQVTTSSIADDAIANVDIDGFNSWALMSIQTDQAAWVRLYVDATARTGDASRTETTDPDPTDGVIAEVITTGAETVRFTPAVIGWNASGTNITAAIKNKSGGTNSITVTLTLLQLEA